MSRHRIKRLLKKYTQSPEYWSKLTAGTPRIALGGQRRRRGTTADEEDAMRKIAKEARRAAALYHVRDHHEAFVRPLKFSLTPERQGVREATPEAERVLVRRLRDDYHPISIRHCHRYS